MKKYGKRKRRRSPLASLVSLLVVLAGVGLIGFALFGGSVSSITDAYLGGGEPPDETGLTLTVPELGRVQEVPVYTAASNDTAALDSGAVHVAGTDFPWQPEANVYIAGHRLGFPGTGSDRLFLSLDALEAGDEVYLTDAEGTTYSYVVFDKFVVEPDAAYVMQTVPGQNLVTLQTCTLPDYSQRLIVQGELVAVA